MIWIKNSSITAMEEMLKLDGIDGLKIMEIEDH